MRLNASRSDVCNAHGGDRLDQDRADRVDVFCEAACAAGHDDVERKRRKVVTSRQDSSTEKRHM